MTGPVWDGRGRDPWLPARLDARLEVARTEREIRAAVWAALSDWLVQLHRRVIRDDRPPDLDAVWARVPMWREAVDLILNGEIWKAIGAAFARLLGPDFEWDTRAFIVRYLAEVRNRLVRIPEEVYDLIAGAVSQGVNLGESIPELSRRVDDLLSTTKSERWPNRAVVIARTEAIGALNAGRAEAFAVIAEQQPDLQFERMWLSTDDSRTRPTHDLADGQRVPVSQPFIVGGFPLMFPGDPTGPAQEVIQCVTGDSPVSFGDFRRAYRRLYRGPLVTIELDSGERLSGSPKHPVLTPGGWVALGELDQGDDLIGAPFSDGSVSWRHDIEREPPSAAQLYDALAHSGNTSRLGGRVVDFHGDGMDGQVEVVTTNVHLVVGHNTAHGEELEKFLLSTPDLPGAAGGESSGPLLGPGTSDSDVGRLGLPSAFLGRHVRPLHSFGLGSSPDGLPSLGEATPDDRARDAERFRQSLLRYSGAVALHKIVSVQVDAFHGHLYNFETYSGCYIVNKIISHNCRCTSLLVEAGESVDLSNRQFRRTR